MGSLFRLYIKEGLLENVEIMKSEGRVDEYGQDSEELAASLINKTMTARMGLDYYLGCQIYIRFQQSILVLVDLGKTEGRKKVCGHSEGGGGRWVRHCDEIFVYRFLFMEQAQSPRKLSSLGRV